MWLAFVLVAAGGLVGAIVRYTTGVLFGRLRINLARFPVHTLVVNLMGSFFLGMFHANIDLSDPVYTVLGVGFCGSLTTFSTFCAELQAMYRARFRVEMAAYLFTSVAVGLVAAFLGTRIHF
jgi:CrcB protein